MVSNSPFNLPLQISPVITTPHYANNAVHFSQTPDSMENYKEINQLRENGNLVNYYPYSNKDSPLLSSQSPDPLRSIKFTQQPGGGNKENQDKNQMISEKLPKYREQIEQSSTSALKFHSNKENEIPSRCNIRTLVYEQNQKLNPHTHTQKQKQNQCDTFQRKNNLFHISKNYQNTHVFHESPIPVQNQGRGFPQALSEREKEITRSPSQSKYDLTEHSISIDVQVSPLSDSCLDYASLNNCIQSRYSHNTPNTSKNVYSHKPIQNNTPIQPLKSSIQSELFHDTSIQDYSQSRNGNQIQLGNVCKNEKDNKLKLSDFEVNLSFGSKKEGGNRSYSNLGKDKDNDISLRTSGKSEKILRSAISNCKEYLKKKPSRSEGKYYPKRFEKGEAHNPKERLRGLLQNQNTVSQRELSKPYQPQYRIFQSYECNGGKTQKSFPESPQNKATVQRNLLNEFYSLNEPSLNQSTDPTSPASNTNPNSSIYQPIPTILSSPVTLQSPSSLRSSSNPSSFITGESRSINESSLLDQKTSKMSFLPRTNTDRSVNKIIKPKNSAYPINTLKSIQDKNKAFDLHNLCSSQRRKPKHNPQSSRHTMLKYNMNEGLEEISPSPQQNERRKIAKTERIMNEAPPDTGTFSKEEETHKNRKKVATNRQYPLTTNSRSSIPPKKATRYSDHNLNQILLSELESELHTSCQRKKLEYRENLNIRKVQDKKKEKQKEKQKEKEKEKQKHKEKHKEKDKEKDKDKGELEKLFKLKEGMLGSLSEKQALSPETLNQIYKISSLENKYLQKIKAKNNTLSNQYKHPTSYSQTPTLSKAFLADTASRISQIHSTITKLKAILNLNHHSTPSIPSFSPSNFTIQQIQTTFQAFFTQLEAISAFFIHNASNLNAAKDEISVLKQKFMRKDRKLCKREAMLRDYVHKIENMEGVHELNKKMRVISEFETKIASFEQEKEAFERHKQRVNEQIRLQQLSLDKQKSQMNSCRNPQLQNDSSQQSQWMSEECGNYERKLIRKSSQHNFIKKEEEKAKESVDLNLKLKQLQLEIKQMQNVKENLVHDLNKIEGGNDKIQIPSIAVIGLKKSKDSKSGKKRVKKSIDLRNRNNKENLNNFNNPNPKNKWK